ncbi:MAG: hypothetical protein DRN71_02810 [Candidatus Nanohalarchaeota archaeon]|nr:MAG: hypothetical protein DRN71_02810 [Candidatus Nanohaloarchaeota archaeon]
MIEAKAIQRIRHAEIKAQKTLDECEMQCARKLECAEKSCMRRIETETEWAKKRALKVVEHAKKAALDERAERLDVCRKDILKMKKSCAPKKKKAIRHILDVVCGGRDA